MSSSAARPRDGIASRSDRGRPPGRLTASEHYRLAYREGTRISDGLLVIYARPNGLPVRRLGIAVPGRVGTAVRRNLVKRRLRAVARAALAAVPEGTDVVIVARTAAAGAPFAALQDSVLALFNRAAGAR
ncbi:MAG TPA: ribonuclease P protein component [bacterium]|nr:ribonuclease P protein component [bacterium]